MFFIGSIGVSISSRRLPCLSAPRHFTRECRYQRRVSALLMFYRHVRAESASAICFVSTSPSPRPHHVHFVTPVATEPTAFVAFHACCFCRFFQARFFTGLLFTSLPPSVSHIAACCRGAASRLQRHLLASLQKFACFIFASLFELRMMPITPIIDAAAPSMPVVVAVI